MEKSSTLLLGRLHPSLIERQQIYEAVLDVRQDNERCNFPDGFHFFQFLLCVQLKLYIWRVGDFCLVRDLVCPECILLSSSCVCINCLSTQGKC